MKLSKSHIMSEAVVAVFRANGRLLEWGDAFTEPFTLTSARWQILGAIARAEQTLTTPCVAEIMGITRQGAQKQLNLLMKDGLVEKLTNPAHRRSPLYKLTERGEEVFKKVNAAWESHAQYIVHHFSKPELETTVRVLEQLARIHTADRVPELSESEA